MQTERLEVKILGGDTGFITVLEQGSDPSVFGNAQLFVTEDETEAQSGTVSALDEAGDPVAFLPVDPANLKGRFGDFTFDHTTGVWGYTVDTATTGGLQDSQSVQDTLKVMLEGDKTPIDLRVTIRGKVDAGDLKSVGVESFLRDPSPNMNILADPIILKDGTGVAFISERTGGFHG